MKKTPVKPETSEITNWALTDFLHSNKTIKINVIKQIVANDKNINKMIRFFSLLTKLICRIYIKRRQLIVYNKLKSLPLLLTIYC